MTALLCAPAPAKPILCSLSLYVIAWHWIWGGQDGIEDSTVGYRGIGVLGQSLGGMVVATSGAYSRSVAEAAQISVDTTPLQLTAQYMAESRWTPTSPGGIPQWGGRESGRGQWSLGQ